MCILVMSSVRRKAASRMTTQVAKTVSKRAPIGEVIIYEAEKNFSYVIIADGY